MPNTENCINAETEATNYSGLPLLVSGPCLTQNRCQRKSIYVMISNNSHGVTELGSLASHTPQTLLTEMWPFFLGLLLADKCIAWFIFLLHSPDIILFKIEHYLIVSISESNIVFLCCFGKSPMVHYH